MEARLPYLAQADGGHGPFILPILRLLEAPHSEEWGAEQQGALRSVLTGRQWPQARRFQAGFTTARCCQLCVKGGPCSETSVDPRFQGTLMHRAWACPMLESYRQRWAPRDWLEEVHSKLRSGSLSAEDTALYTRGLLKTPAALLDSPPLEASFEWVVRPPEEACHALAFSDGSRIDAGADLFGLCARQGWGLAIYNEQRQLVAAACGRPPWWATGIHAAELWALLQGALCTDPFCKLWVDCRSVLLGARRDLAWARAGTRRLARAWGPLAAVLHGGTCRVAWMPSHCPRSGPCGRALDCGDPLTVDLIAGNDAADKLARRAAERDRLPEEQRTFVRLTGQRLTSLAKWLGRVNAVSNAFPFPGVSSQKIRDAAGPIGSTAAQRCKRKEPPHEASFAPGSEPWKSPRTAVLRQRVLERERLYAAGPICSTAAKQCKRKEPPREVSFAPGSEFWKSPRMAALRQRIIERERLPALVS